MGTIRQGISKAIVALAVATGTGGAAAQVEYRIPGLADFSGPYADLTKHLLARNAVIKWWNDNDGKKLGVKLTVKDYDTRYDGTIVASMWPGILAEMKPIIGMGLGGVDLNALQQRLPNDKVPMIYSTPGYGFGWLADQWVFNPRATYVHEWVTGLTWYAAQNPQKKPLKVAFLSTQASPAFVDFVKGIDMRNLVFGAGRSGTTGELLKTYRTFGRNDDGESFKQYLLAIVVYLVGGGHHTCHEIFSVANLLIGSNGPRGGRAPCPGCSTIVGSRPIAYHYDV